jgi:hypothetical protein
MGYEFAKRTNSRHSVATYHNLSKRIIPSVHAGWQGVAKIILIDFAL